MMKAGGLVIELFPFEGNGCSYFQALAESCGLESIQIYPEMKSLPDQVEDRTATLRGRLARRLLEIARIEALDPDTRSANETAAIAPEKKSVVVNKLGSLWKGHPRSVPPRSVPRTREHYSRVLSKIEWLKRQDAESLSDIQRTEMNGNDRTFALEFLQKEWSANIPDVCWGSRHQGSVQIDVELVVSALLGYVDARRMEPI